MYSPQVAVKSGLAMEGIFAAADGALELLRLTVNRLDVHQEVVSNAKATPTLLALYIKK